MTLQYREQLAVPNNHPAFAGHFPGAPVVPGVLLLDWILQMAERRVQQTLRVTALNQVKFHSPLLPGQCCEVLLNLHEQVLDFRVSRKEQLVAQGRFQVHESKSL